MINPNSPASFTIYTSHGKIIVEDDKTGFRGVARKLRPTQARWTSGFDYLHKAGNTLVRYTTEVGGNSLWDCAERLVAQMRETAAKSATCPLQPYDGETGTDEEYQIVHALPPSSCIVYVVRRSYSVHIWYEYAGDQSGWRWACLRSFPATFEMRAEYRHAPFCFTAREALDDAIANHETYIGG